MFTVLPTHKGRAENKEGIVVEVTDWSQLTYKDSPYTLKLHAELGVPNANGIAAVHIFFPMSIHWQPPYDSEVISYAKAQEIKTNLKKAVSVLVKDSYVDFYDEMIAEI